jgi:2'-5' RNA ligase
MYKGPATWDRINSFALVSYIPEPLAGYLDRLRQELVPNCFLRAHVTILPPRPIVTSPKEAWEVIQRIAPQFPPFEVELESVEVFPVSDVIYIKLSAGIEDLQRMHKALNINGLSYQEPFPYHPHITLAQDLRTDELDELASVARARWAEFSFSKKFRVEKVVFVQNTRLGEWLDLGECSLGHAESKLVEGVPDQLVG